MSNIREAFCANNNTKYAKQGDKQWIIYSFEQYYLKIYMISPHFYNRLSYNFKPLIQYIKNNKKKE